MDLPPTQESSSTSSTGDQTLTLIPGFPHKITAKILISLPYSHRCRLRATARAWHAFLSQASVAPSAASFASPRTTSSASSPPILSSTTLTSMTPPAAAWSPLPLLPFLPFLSGLSNFTAIALGHHLYILDGSNLDTRSYPVGMPLLFAKVYRFDLSALSAPWTQISDMISPCASFTCASFANVIIVAGGGSRDDCFPSRVKMMRSVEVFDVGSGEWAAYDGFLGSRSGCVGLFRRVNGDEGEDEFWVIGGHGDYRHVERVIPTNIHYKNALVLGSRRGKWREGGDM